MPAGGEGSLDAWLRCLLLFREDVVHIIERQQPPYACGLIITHREYGLAVV